MPDSLANIIIDELKTELKSKYPDFRGIYLFGSRARGDYHDDSDYDLAFVFEREITRDFKDQIRILTSRIMIKHNIIVDTIVYNVKDLLTPITPLRESVIEEGIYYE
jgi:uncharacterized protein